MNREPLLRWQWRLYPAGHTHPTNLFIHVLTVPLFWVGSAAFLATPLLGRVGLVGLVPVVVAIAAQGRGHAREPVAPVPFRGPWDFVARIFVEQWVTFPRFVLSGRLRAALRDPPAS
jgi:hypothetical protein